MTPTTQPREQQTADDEESVPYGQVPGPGILGYFGAYLGLFGNNPAKSFSWMKDRWGEVVRVHLPVGGSTFLTSKPDHVQYVLEKNQKNYQKAKPYRELKHVMGEGLLTSEGDKWLQQHRLMMPMFHQSSVMEFGDMILDEAHEMMNRWEDKEKRNEPIDLLEEMKRITLQIICRALFSSDVEGYISHVSEDLETLRKAFRTRVRGFNLPLWVPTPTNRKAKKAISRLESIVNGLIEDRKGHADEYEDFLSMLMLAEDEETGETMSHEQIRDEVMTFFLAGHETTANALTWTWYALANNPDIHMKLYNHVSSVLGDHDGQFSMELYEELDYAGQVIDESMRLYPPVPVFAREAIEDDKIGKYEIPAGTSILLSQFLIHRDESIWDNPEEFDPERFTDGKQDERHRFSYFPFGGGARMCIGRELALLEARIILSLVVNEYRLERSEPSREIGTDVAVTMSPSDPILMDLKRW